MKDIINLFDSELRAVVNVQMELWEQLQKQKYYTKNEKMIKDVMQDKFGKLVEATAELQEFINQLKDFDEFELGYGLEVGEIVKRDPSSSFGLRRDENEEGRE